VDAEFDALQKNGSWYLVPTKPGSNVIDYKWMYKVKRKADGTSLVWWQKDLCSGMELIMRTCLVQLSRQQQFD
jgi:hypothetical protein